MISKTTLDILEFSKLLRLIAGFANSTVSEASVLAIQPFSERNAIETRFGQISEIRKMSQQGNSLSLCPFPDITHLLMKLRPEGAVLDAGELADFVPVLSIASSISAQLGDRDDLPFLKALADHLTGFPDIRKTLKKSIDSEGNILDSASLPLSEIRSGIRKLEGKIRKKLDELVRDERISVFLQDSFVTKRSGRWVIPVRMDSKGMVPGVVHDISKSGETAFIEPLSIINLSNEMENLNAEQKAEELRVLKNICAVIRTVIDEVLSEFHTIVYLDLLNCIAKVSDMLRMVHPQINDAGSIHLIGARHPLLQLSLNKSDNIQQIVPLDVRLGGEQTVMVITGANAGGKTIAIKTIGLLLLMALSGIPVPADSSSSIPLLQNLLVDIGDEQSIENNLSTFSAHISNISGIVKNKDAKTIILIDELGTGTDPDEGAALACAILKDIRKSGALLFATTHLADIKGFVHRTPGMVNASMEFDQKTLTPLFRLRIGEPGQSHALEIARRYGIPDPLIHDAKLLLGNVKSELDHMISDMNRKRIEYENALKSLEQEKTECAEKNRMLAKMVADTKEEQGEIFAAAYKQAADIIAATKRQMHAFLDDIRKREKSERQKIMKKVDVEQEYVNGKIRELDVGDPGAPVLDDIREGDILYIKSLGYDASVIGVNRKNSRLKVVAKNKEIEVPITDIGYKRGKSLPELPRFSRNEQADEPVSSRINLIGLRVDEALSGLETFLNHASLAELQEVTIIHGVGKGLLSKAIHEHLEGHPLIKKYRRGTTEEGGAGVTVATMQ
jgi:DNA mismatch repair protein MutS2